MSTNPFDCDDPRLTAYVLGELDAEAKLEVEQLLETSPEALAAVDELREVSEFLRDHLSTEPAPELTATQRLAVEEECARSIPQTETPKVTARGSRNATVAALTSLSIAVAAAVLLFLPPIQPNSNEQAKYDAGRDPESRFGHGNATVDFAYTMPNEEQSKNPDSSQPVSELSAVTGESAAGLGDKRWNSHNGEQHSSGKVSGRSVPKDQPSDIDLTVKVESKEVLNAATLGRNPGDERRTQRMTREEQRRRFGQYKPNSTGQTSKPVPSEAANPSKPTNSPAAPGTDSPRPNLGSVSRYQVNNFGESAKGTDLSKTGQFGVGFNLGKPFSGEVTPGSESYRPIVENPFLSPRKDPLSTFSIDIDTACYSNVRRFLTNGQWPPANAVRIEELVNYFHYDYPQPDDGRPFSVTLEVGACPWNVDHRLVRVGLKGKEIAVEERPASNLVFLLDVSGSMSSQNKLPLVKAGLNMLVEGMTENDRISIVTYAGRAGVALNSTSGEHTDEILSTIQQLTAGGSTNGEAGIQLAYQQAVENLIKEGTNRVILCTDGDFNVGTSGDEELVELVRKQAKSGVFLSVFGFGMGNLKDAKLEQIADNGNGQYAYIDNRREARKVFVEDLSGTLYTIAKDVKIQVEFNPAQVGAYRLIGYENRMLAARDFNDDTKDAGEIGAGHTVTALYEIVSPDKLPTTPDVDALKYQPQPKPVSKNREKDDKISAELLTVKLRYKLPDAESSTRVEFPLVDNHKRNAKPSRDFEWVAAVASFGMLLRNSQYKGKATFQLARELAQGSRKSDLAGHRREFLELIDAAQAMRAKAEGKPVPATR